MGAAGLARRGELVAGDADDVADGFEARHDAAEAGEAVHVEGGVRRGRAVLVGGHVESGDVDLLIGNHRRDVALQALVVSGIDAFCHAEVLILHMALVDLD